MSDVVPVSEKIRRARRAKELSQEGLDDALGVPRGRTFSYERGRATVPEVVVRRIAKALDIAPDWFFDGEDTPPPTAKPRQPDPQPEATTSADTEEEVRLLPFESLPKELQSLVRGDRVLLPLWRGVMGSPDGECEFVEADAVEWIEVPAFLAGRDYDRCRVCQVAGMSMAPRIRQGDRVVVRVESNPSTRPDHRRREAGRPVEAHQGPS